MESKPVEMFVKGHLHRRFCSAFSLFDKNIVQQLFQYLTDDKKSTCIRSRYFVTSIIRHRS